MKKYLCSLSLVCFALPLSLNAADLHVSPTGKDSNAGTEAAPFSSLSAARDAARKFAGKEAVTVHVADGVYYLPEALVFTAADSGSEAAPVSYEAVNEGGAVLSGGSLLSLDWKEYKDGIFQAETPAGLKIDQLFINGRNQRMARYPNFDPTKKAEPFQGYSANAFSKERAASWADPAGGYIHAMHSAGWGGYQYLITGKDAQDEVTFEGGWQNNRQMGMHKDHRMVENIFEELDAPNEWYHNAKTNTLYYMPEKGVDLAQAKVEVVRLRHLVEFKGSAKASVKHITLKGFTLRHAARTFMDTKEPLLRSDWTIYRGGAVFLTGTQDVSILDCEFDQVGGNAIFVNNYNRRALIKGCHIHDAGASGVCFVGDPDAVRDPLFEYAKTQDLTKIDRTPGPKTNNFPQECAVEDSLIHGIGRVERQPAGVEISMAFRIKIRDTSIYDCARAGINVSEGTWGGHLIERCDVFDTVLETHDHGSFNSWGRDRFWAPNHRGVSEPEVKKHPELPYLDAIETIVIRASRWRCDHGWDIDLDDGSSNYEITNNLLLGGGLKFREGYGRKATNNIIVQNGFHPHVWFEKSMSSFQFNIVKKAHAPVRQPKGWGELVDHNWFLSEGELERAKSQGSDAHSLAGELNFIDPASGDFRVEEGSLVFKIGFKNFPMDQFGVKKPSLKALARTPEIPQPAADADAETSASLGDVTPEYFWLGAPLDDIEGEGYSAFGVSKDDAGVILERVPKGSLAANFGLFERDLIQEVNGQKTRNVSQFMAVLLKTGDSPLALKVIRNQQLVSVTVMGGPFITYESAPSGGDLIEVPLPSSPSGEITAMPATSNQALATMTDGKLEKNYGAVFANSVSNGAYKMDLEAAKEIAAINSWAFNQNSRGIQRINLYGSASEKDPGWDLSDATEFTAIGSIDTTSSKAGAFTAVSLRGSEGASLGKYRWIVWKAWPLNKQGENSSFQELSVETKLDK